MALEGQPLTAPGTPPRLAEPRPDTPEQGDAGALLVSTVRSEEALSMAAAARALRTFGTPPSGRKRRQSAGAWTPNNVAKNCYVCDSKVLFVCGGRCWPSARTAALLACL